MSAIAVEADDDDWDADELLGDDDMGERRRARAERRRGRAARRAAPPLAQGFRRLQRDAPRPRDEASAASPPPFVGAVSLDVGEERDYGGVVRGGSRRRGALGRRPRPPPPLPEEEDDEGGDACAPGFPLPGFVDPPRSETQRERAERARRARALRAQRAEALSRERRRACARSRSRAPPRARSEALQALGAALEAEAGPALAQLDDDDADEIAAAGRSGRAGAPAAPAAPAAPDAPAAPAAPAADSLSKDRERLDALERPFDDIENADKRAAVAAATGVVTRRRAPGGGRADRVGRCR